MVSGKKAKRQGQQEPKAKRPAGGIPPPDSSSVKVNSPRRIILLALWLIVILGPLVYGNTFDVPFLFDDKPNILDNRFIRVSQFTTESLKGILNSHHAHRPFAYLTFAVNYYFHQYEKTGYHVVNLSIHLLTAFLVFLITRQTLGLLRQDHTWTAIPVALLWLVNPIHTQSVTYIVQRMNTLATMFYLMAMACYIQARLIQRRNKIHGFFSLFLLTVGVFSALLGLLSKEIVITLPLIILLYEWYFFQDLNTNWLKKHILWIGGALLTMAVISLLFLKGTPLAKLSTMYATKEFTLTQRLLTEPGVVLYYLSLLVFPFPDRLQIIYDFPMAVSLFSVSTLLSLIALAGLIAAAWRLRHSHKMISFAIFWFLINLVLESSVLPLAFVFEHRTYLPSIFVFAALSVGVFSRKYAKTTLAIVTVIIVLHGFWTWRRNAVWTDKISFWSDAVKKTSEKSWTHNNLGVELIKINRNEEAAIHCRRALDINPLLEMAHHNLGLISLLNGQNDLARKYFKQALEINPNLKNPYNYLGIACIQKGETEQALVYFKKALEIDPYYTEAADNLDRVEQIIKQYGQAITLLKQALKEQPNNFTIIRKLAAINRQAGMEGVAIDLYEQALGLQPECEECLESLTTMYWSINHFHKSAQMLERLTLLHPDFPKFFYSLACAYARNNQKIKALKVLKESVEKGFSDIDYIRNDEALTIIRDTEYFRKLTGSAEK